MPTRLPPIQSPDDPIRVLVVDDHEVVRQGIRNVFQIEPDVEIVGEASDPEEALSRAEETSPDVVLMDVQLKNGSGIDATRAIKDLLPNTAVIMLTVSDDQADLYAAIKAGASGYLLKNVAMVEVADAIRQVHSGQSLISPSMASKLLNEFSSMVRGREDRQEVPAPRLTARELEVLKLVATGLNNRDIGKQLFISENTVKNHVRNMLEKLQLHSRMEAVVYAVREKLLEIT